MEHPARSTSCERKFSCDHNKWLVVCMQRSVFSQVSRWYGSVVGDLLVPFDKLPAR